MGIFSRLMEIAQPDPQFKYNPDSEQEAWTAILYAIIAADGTVKEVEVDQICDLLMAKTLFDDTDVTDLYRLVSEAHKKVGGKELIEQASQHISEENKPTILALAADLILSDGEKSAEEDELAIFLANSMAVSAEVAQTVFQVMEWKNQHNKLREE